MLAAWATKLAARWRPGVRVQDLERLAERNPFSAFLPYLAYDPETRTYVLQDETVGALWECAPLAFASEQTVNGLDGLFRLGLPEGAVIQLILHADPHIDPYLDAYARLKTRDAPTVRTCAEEFTGFLRSGKDGLEKLAGIPARSFRLFVALKVPTAKTPSLRWEYLRAGTEEILRGVSLWPASVTPEDLLEWSRRLLNDDPGGNPRHYDDSRPIRDQIVYAETAVRDEGRTLGVGASHWAVLTPKANPKEVDLFTTGFLVGGVWGLVSDADQIQTPFLLSLNLIFENLVPKLHAKCNLVLGQGAAGSFAPSLERKKREYLTAVDSLERGAVFVRALPTLWVWGEDKQVVAEALTRARRIWESSGYVMQQDRGILKVLFLLSLPFGLYVQGKNLENIARDTIVDSEAATAILPVQADFAGGGRPALLFVGRKGQLATLDFFDERANNHNFLIAAESGSGKSFATNYIAHNYWANEAMVRIVDIGGSYRKLARLTGGRYIDFGDGARGEPLCLNPFTHIAEPEHELSVIDATVAQMIYSHTGAIPSETESSLIRSAVQWAWSEEENEADVDTIYHFLANLNDVPHGDDAPMLRHPKILEAAGMLSFNLRDFTSQGSFGPFFNGRSTFDIRNDELVVLELEHLKGQTSLFRVVTLLVINAVTQDLYLSDRSRERFILFDEAWQFLDREADTLAHVINEGYRRARKYQGAFGIIVQSIEDLAHFGKVGQVILNNSSFKLYLQSSGFVKAKQKGLVDYDDFTLRILQSLASKKGDYSEIFADTPFGMGVLRLVVDPFFYGVCTSSGKENARIERGVAQGMTHEEAIRAMLAEREG